MVALLHHREGTMPRYLVWLMVGAFAIGTEGFMIAGILPLIATDLRVSTALAGQLVTAFALAYAIGSPTLTVATSIRSEKGSLVVDTFVPSWRRSRPAMAGSWPHGFCSASAPGPSFRRPAAMPRWPWHRRRRCADARWP